MWLRRGDVAMAMWPHGFCEKKTPLMVAVIRHGPKPLAVVLLDEDTVKLLGNNSHDCRVGPLALAVVRRLFGR